MPDVPTLQDVAHRARVSLATASRALDPDGRRAPREDLRLRVQQAAAELGYTPNSHAQAVARGRSDVVALVVHDISDPYFSSIAAGVMDAAASNGLLVTLASTQRDPAAEADIVATFRRYRAQAVVLIGSRTTDREATGRLAEELAAFEAAGGRAVAVTQGRLPVDTIEFENRSGAAALGTALASAGYRRFAVLGGPPALVTSEERVAGFRSGLSRLGIRLETADVLSYEFTRDGGYDGMRALLSRAARPECVFAVNDVMAIGALAAARDSGLSLPDEIAVAGFDDIPGTVDVTPPLTTVRIPLREVGAQALKLALQPRSKTPQLIQVPGETLLRASTPSLRA